MYTAINKGWLAFGFCITTIVQLTHTHDQHKKLENIIK